MSLPRLPGGCWALLPAIAIIIPGSLGGNGPAVFRWPAVRPVAAQFHVSRRSPSATLIIKGSGGQPLYRLACAPVLGDWSRYGCRLEPISGPRPWVNLLSDAAYPEDVNGVAFSRATFTAPRRAPARASARGVKRTAEFRLRGMRIQISLDGTVARAGGAETAGAWASWHTLALGIAIAPDPEAMAGSAAAAAAMRTAARVEMSAAARTGWPLVEAASAEFKLGGRMPSSGPAPGPWPRAKALAYLPIRAASGAGYVVECVGSVWPPDETSPDWRIEKYGITCGLFAGGSGPNLLDGGPDPISGYRRWTFYPDQLYGACGRYPQWGSDRSFRLRSMAVRISISAARFVGDGPWGRHALVSARLRISAVPDAGARSGRAAPTKFVLTPESSSYWNLPPGACARVFILARRRR